MSINTPYAIRRRRAAGQFAKHHRAGRGEEATEGGTESQFHAAAWKMLGAACWVAPRLVNFHHFLAVSFA